MLSKQCINITLRQDMIDLFDPVVATIISLLEQQIQATRSESKLQINVRPFSLRIVTSY
jgi:hypothetical protein